MCFGSTSGTACAVVLPPGTVPSVPPPPQECNDPATLLAKHAHLFGGTTLQLPHGGGGGDDDNRKWNEADLRHPDVARSLESPRCTLRRVPLYDVSKERFREEFYDKEPVVLVAPLNRSQPFADLTQRNVLLKCFGEHTITLSTANQHSYRKTQTTLRDYFTRHLRPQNLSVAGDETLYWFGDHNPGDFDAFWQQYHRPTEQLLDAAHQSLSFGIAATGTGVPLHTHGPVFAETLHGKKRWRVK